MVGHGGVEGKGCGKGHIVGLGNGLCCLKPLSAILV